MPYPPAACGASIPRLAVFIVLDLISNIWHVLHSEVTAALSLLGNLLPQQWPPPEFEWAVAVNRTDAAGEFGPFEHSIYRQFSAPSAPMHRLYDPAVTTCFLGGLAAGTHYDNVAVDYSTIRRYYPMQRELALVEVELRTAHSPSQAQRYAVMEAPLRSRPVRIAIMKRHSGVRVMRNHDALLAALQRGIGCGQFEVVEIEPGVQAPGVYVPILNTAHMLLGVHGAAMTNAALLPRGAVVLELTHKATPEGTRMYAGWSAMAGVAFARVTDLEWALPEGGETWAKERDHDIIVDVEKVIVTVRALVATLLRSDSACLQQWGNNTQSACVSTDGCTWCDDCAIAPGLYGTATSWLRQPEVYPSQAVMLGQFCIGTVDLNRFVGCA